MPDAFLISAARTPIGKYLGALADVRAADLGAIALRKRCAAATCRPIASTR